MKTQFIDLVPKDFHANLKWRKDVLEMCQTDELARNDFFDMCSRDLLFYVNTFHYTLNPRDVWMPVIPFISYDYQDESWGEMYDAFGKEDILIQKARDMGATWMNIILFEYFWHFVPNMNLLFASRKQDLVYKKGNESALFSKVDFIHKYLPEWLIPLTDYRELHLRNLDNDSTIDGESTTQNLATGDRRTAMLLDEFAKTEVADGFNIAKSTRAVTQCRIFNSTFFGTGNAFYDLSNNKNIKKISLCWWFRPEFGAGLYQVDGSNIIIIDKTYDFTDYAFNYNPPQNKEGYRSPWYDAEEKRCVSIQEMAEEVDMNAIGGNYQYFEPQLIDRLKRETVRPPYRKGSFIVDSRHNITGFMDDENGDTKLWCVFEENPMKPVKHEYFMGVDVAVGTGATPSTITVGDGTTKEKVVEIANANFLPYRWAELAHAVGRFFNDAMLCWERNGAGREFGIRIEELEYGNVYFKTNMETGVSTPIAGWQSGREEKRLLLSEYRQALFDGSFINRSNDALNECLDYVMGTDGSLEHLPSKNTKDPNLARDNHGDRVIADACCNMIMKNASRYELEEPPEIPVNCVYHRMMEAINKNKRVNSY